MTHDHRTMAGGPMPCECAVFRIADHGTFLATRHLAEGIRAWIEPRRRERTVLDFTGVEAITVAFADELVAKLRADNGDRVRWEGANPEVAETIQLAITRRSVS